MGRTTDLESWEPFTGLRKLIENPRLRCWGKNGTIYSFFELGTTKTLRFIAFLGWGDFWDKTRLIRDDFWVKTTLIRDDFWVKTTLIRDGDGPKTTK